jgi:hypothetical protein
MKLTFNKEENSYSVNRKKPFNGLKINETDLQKAFDFSFEMCFGKGHHREHRSGGQHERKKGEIFCNTFQGKLSEIVIYDYFIAQGLYCEEPDFSILGKGIWDDADLLVQGKKINIKSIAFFSDLLLLETKDWNSKAQYIPNIKNNATSSYDYFILVKIKPDVKRLFKSNDLYYSNDIQKDFLKKILFENQKWDYEITGYCTNKTILHIIENKYILPQNSLLNGKTKLDATNYYVQSGELREIEFLTNELKTIQFQ